MIFDLAIIGGGINGCGIARDAAGRGLTVLLAEQDDLASATSGASSKLIHGGLRYLEQYQFRLVREALQEREVLLNIAPHIIHPLDFVVPHDRGMRPAWMIRAGLFLYDHIGGKISLPPSRGLAFPDERYSAGLRPAIHRGFVYSDARVDDARLTVLNAMSARAFGATIMTRTRVEEVKRATGAWHMTLRDTVSQATTQIHAHAIVNAAGPWVQQVLEGSAHMATTATVRLVKGAHIVVPRIHEQEHAYLLQNDDGRVVFVIPYEGKYSLIGTTDVAVDNIAEGGAITDAETRYLLRAVNRYFARGVQAQDVVWSYAGIRPLYNDGHTNPAAVTRDYVLKVDDGNGNLPLLSIFGGKITTYRRLAEHALDQLRDYFPERGAQWREWTATAALPGGDVDDDGQGAGRVGRVVRYAQALSRQHPGVPPDFIQRLVMRHGTNTAVVLQSARVLADLGELFGRGLNLLCEREIEYLIASEWARSTEDILWRRTKCGLHMDNEERARAGEFIDKKLKAVYP